MPHKTINGKVVTNMIVWNQPRKDALRHGGLQGSQVSVYEKWKSACLFAPSRFITNGAEWTQTLDMLPTVIILKLAFVGGAVIPLLTTWQDTRTLIETRFDVWGQI